MSRLWFVAVFFTDSETRLRRINHTVRTDIRRRLLIQIFPFAKGGNKGP